MEVDKTKKYALLISGGVDSAVACHLMCQQGLKPDLFYIKIGMQGEGTSCSAEEDIELSTLTAKKYGLSLQIIDLQQEYHDRVTAYVVDRVKRGLTPNPDVMCNRLIKFGAFEEKAGYAYDYIATGHYARVEQLPNGRYTLRVAKGIEKDQTYALYNLTQDQLSKTLMPVGEYNKTQIRQIAADIGIQVANKPDSQDICFVPDGDYAGYLEREEGLKAVPGNFVDMNGKILGTHKGIIHYTVGQRKRLGLAMGHPVFVVDIIPETNEVVIGENADTFSKELIADKTNFMSVERPEDGMQVIGKIRYAHKGVPCRIYMLDDDRVRVVFDEPVRAATKGQAVVFYEDDYIVGGGTIKEIIR